MYSIIVFLKVWTFCRPFLDCCIAHAHMRDPGGNISVEEICLTKVKFIDFCERIGNSVPNQPEAWQQCP